MYNSYLHMDGDKKYRAIPRTAQEEDRPLEAEEGRRGGGTDGDKTVEKRCRVIHYILLILCIVIVSIVTLAVTLTVKGKEGPRPHVVLIVADDMGFNDIGYYNFHKDIYTPHLDKLAQEGVRLDRYYGQSICTPARAALFTGRYPFRYGLQGARPILYGSTNGLPLSENQILPQVMKEAGYKTNMVGKWHLGYSKWGFTPVMRGYDYFYGMYGGFADYFTHESAEPETPNFSAFDLHEHTLNAEGEIVETEAANIALVKKTYNVYSERLFTDKATEIIKNHDTASPLFLTVCYMNPHSPLQTLPDDLARVPEEVTNDIRRRFSALMSSLDYGVQQITEALKSKGIYDDTIFIFTGDNGGAVQGPEDGKSLGGTNYPLRGAKWTVWEGGVRVPAFVRGPGIPANTSTSELFHITDWLPTLAKVVGVKTKKVLDGVDQLELLRGEVSTSSRQEIILELDPAFQQAAIIKDNFKLLVGDPGAKPYNDIYQPLTGDEVWYFEGNEYGGTDMYKTVSATCQTKVEHFKQQILDGLKFRNISAIGSFNVDNVRLYDLETDPSESYDLYTTYGRFEDKAKELYDRLGQRCGQMSDLVFFVGGDLKDIDSSYEVLEFQEEFMSMNEINKWRPWL